MMITLVPFILDSFFRLLRVLSFHVFSLFIFIFRFFNVPFSCILVKFSDSVMFMKLFSDNEIEFNWMTALQISLFLSSPISHNLIGVVSFLDPPPYKHSITMYQIAQSFPNYFFSDFLIILRDVFFFWVFMKILTSFVFLYTFVEPKFIHKETEPLSPLTYFFKWGLLIPFIVQANKIKHLDGCGFYCLWERWLNPSHSLKWKSTCSFWPNLQYLADFSAEPAPGLGTSHFFLPCVTLRVIFLVFTLFVVHMTLFYVERCSDFSVG